MAIYAAFLGHVDLPDVGDFRPRQPSEVRVDRRPAKRRRRAWEA